MPPMEARMPATNATNRIGSSDAALRDGIARRRTLRVETR
jgi:hypothetical protein